VGALNLRFPVALGGSASGSVRIGAKYRNKNKDQSVSAFTMELDDAADDIVLGSDVGAPFSNSGFNPGSYPMPFTTSIGDVAAFQSRFAGRLTDPEADPEEQSAAYELSERVLAAYALAELNLSSRLMLLPGLRYEHTQLESDGQEFDADAGTLSPRSAGNAYGNVFPMIHMRYRASNATNIRAALTTAIFRPNFFDLVPYIVRDGEDIEQGNPDLDPVSATNFDLMLERYDSDIGLLSAGVFVKWLRKPIFVRTADNDIGGETSQPINAESGEILGFEVAFQKRFTSLPGALNGLGVYANYTWTDSKATQHNGRDTRLAGQAENAYNLALSYEKHRFSGQVSVNHVGGYIDELGDDDEGDLFADGRTQVDLSASYFVISNAQLFLEATNLGNAPYRTYQFRNDRVRQLEFYEPSLQVGLRFRP
jgi:TonB-dependent receptor